MQRACLLFTNSPTGQEPQTHQTQSQLPRGQHQQQSVQLSQNGSILNRNATASVPGSSDGPRAESGTSAQERDQIAAILSSTTVISA